MKLQVHTPGSGYICGLNRETVKVVMLDELMKNPENPSPEFFQELDIKVLFSLKRVKCAVSWEKEP